MSAAYQKHHHCQAGAVGKFMRCCRHNLFAISNNNKVTTYVPSSSFFLNKCGEWLVFVCIVRCSKRGICYQGNKVAYHFCCTTRTGICVGRPLFWSHHSESTSTMTRKVALQQWPHLCRKDHNTEYRNIGLTCAGRPLLWSHHSESTLTVTTTVAPPV